MSAGWLKVVGLGPGDPRWLTPQAGDALREATDLVGYQPYLDRVPLAANEQARHGSDNRVERARAEDALRLAASGRRVVVVSSGDPGIFAMAAAVIEAIDEGDPDWRQIDLEIVPGLSAMQAAASRIGAPLGHDFCVISLSDNLKPWSIVERRLEAAFDADFVVALYNPASRSRPDGIRIAIEIAARHRSASTPVLLARAVGTPEEMLSTVTLATVPIASIDMRTLVLIGSSETRIVERAPLPTLLYTSRRYGVGK